MGWIPFRHKNGVSVPLNGLIHSALMLFYVFYMVFPTE